MAKIITGKVRFSYVNIFKARAAMAGGDEKYSISLLIPKSDKVTIKKIEAAVEEAIQEGISSKWGGKRPANLKLPLRDGDTERDTPEYEGCFFLNANSNQKPGIVDRDLMEILDPEEVYSGCFYGTLKEQIESKLDEGYNVVFDVDVAGGCNIKKYFGEKALSIFIMPPSVEELRRRLEARATDSQETIGKRLAKADQEIAYSPRFDTVIVNDDMNTAKKEAYRIVTEFLNA